MARTLYTAALYLLLPCVLLRLLWRSVRAPAYLQRWPERFGFIAPTAAPAQPCIWLHAVSVGETLAAVPLVRKLRSSHPHLRIVLTTMTPTGSERVRRILGDEVAHYYVPYDYPGAVKRFLKKIRPQCLVLMETELWPNAIHYTSRSGARVLLANARLSEKSARGYARLSTLTEPMLSAIDRVAVQAAEDARRFRQLGCPEARLHVTGSVKFEFEQPGDLAQRSAELQALIGADRPVWIAASTRAGEEEKVLVAHKYCLSFLPSLLLILVPRHPERFNSVARLCGERGLSVTRRSQQVSITACSQVLLGDSMGEMLAYYSVSNLAFVGGSLVDTGCQNVVEPAALGLPVLTGPSQFNFSTICRRMEQAGALHTVRDEHELGARVIALQQNAALRKQMGNAGRAVVRENSGALEATWRLVSECLEAAPAGRPVPTFSHG